jgi:hypothetical protein
MPLKSNRALKLALVVLLGLALGTGTGAAGSLITGADIKDGSIASADIKNGSLQENDVKDGSLASVDVKDNSLQGADVKDGTLASSDVKDGTLASADVKDNSLQGADVKDGSLASADITNNSLQGADVKDGSLGSADIADGSIQMGDLAAAVQEALNYAGPNWSIVDRNVIGNGDAYLRAGPSNGPVAPPSGIGSLGLRTGSSEDAAAFGNQVDFVNMPVLNLHALAYSVFTTQENNARGANNMPAISLEFNPRLASLPGDIFATMVYVPPNGFPLAWNDFNAVTDPDPHWGLTNVPAGTTCDNNGPRCTFQQLMDFLDDGGPAPFIYTVQITQGRNFAFSGAVDNLRVNDTIYDFEPTGVVATPVAP